MRGRAWSGVGGTAASHRHNEQQQDWLKRVADGWVNAVSAGRTVQKRVIGTMNSSRTEEGGGQLGELSGLWTVQRRAGSVLRQPTLTYQCSTLIEPQAIHDVALPVLTDFDWRSICVVCCCCCYRRWVAAALLVDLVSAVRFVSSSSGQSSHSRHINHWAHLLHEAHQP